MIKIIYSDVIHLSFPVEYFFLYPEGERVLEGHINGVHGETGGNTVSLIKVMQNSFQNLRRLALTFNRQILLKQSFITKNENCCSMKNHTQMAQ